MPKYVSLLNFTEQGAKAIKNSTSRAAQFTEAAAKAGVKVEAQYWTVGPYDGVLILDAPDEQRALRVLVDLVALGNVRTQTMSALAAQQFEATVGR